MLRVVLDRVAGLCTENLRGASTQPAHILLKGIDVGPAGDMVAALDGASIVGVLNTPKWDSRLLVVADRATVFALVEMLLGGDGSQPPYSAERPFTKLETKVMGAFFHRVGQALSTAFAQIAATPVVVEACSERCDLDAVGGRSTQVVLVRFGVEVWDRAGEFLLAIPRAVLAPMREALSRATAKDAPKIDPVWSQRIQSEINRTSVSIRAVLDERWITLGEVADLKVGQVMPLNATPSSRVRVECYDEPLLWCQLGKSNGVYTLRVDEFIDPQQEFMDDILFG
ncbi:MAG TPA: FliM/FliN family flagellar motor switch protein [Hyphomicrobiaceae bacterium]|nr:FliM/FliN family flagellar motor switch protein [Hyphomicrobiaceae bacterium]